MADRQRKLLHRIVCHQIFPGISLKHMKELTKIMCNHTCVLQYVLMVTDNRDGRVVKLLACGPIVKTTKNPQNNSTPPNGHGQE